jgi:phospholipid-binding lipoprotein MlaA
VGPQATWHALAAAAIHTLSVWGAPAGAAEDASPPAPTMQPAEASGGPHGAERAPADADVTETPSNDAVDDALDDRPLPPGLEDAEAGIHPDPLGAINEPIFAFNRWLDDWVLRPVARGYGWVLPEPAREAVGRFFVHIDVIPRVVNNVLQLHFRNAGVETARFGINTTIGLVGFFDPALHWFHLEAARNDFGLTCRSYGIPAGPYLMLPFFGPSTVTDGTGLVVDWFMNPIRWFVPVYVSVAVSAGRATVEAVNYRSLHLDQFADVDRYVIDLYGAVQDFYLQQRTQRLAELEGRE